MNHDPIHNSDVRINIDRLAQHQREATRLRQTLEYYQWLGTKGVDYSAIRGIANVLENRRRYATNLSLVKRLALQNSYSYLLENGGTVILDNVPFHEDVIYNRSRL